MSNQRPERPGLTRNDFSAHTAADLKLSPHKPSEAFGFELVPSSTASAPNGAAAVGNQNERWFSAAAPENGVISDASSDATVYVYHDEAEYEAIPAEMEARREAESVAARAVARQREADFYAALGLTVPPYDDSEVNGSIDSSANRMARMAAVVAEYRRVQKGKYRAIDSPISPMETGDSDGKEPNEASKALEAAGSATGEYGYCTSLYRTFGVRQNTCTTTIAGPSGTNGRKMDNDDNYNKD